MNELNEFQKICSLTLGREYLKSLYDSNSFTSSVIQIFSDFQQINLPWWKIGKMAGIYFFYNHIFLNYQLLSQSINSDVDELKAKINPNEFRVIQTPDFIKDLFSNILNDVNSWHLLSIENKENNQNLLGLLHYMKCPSLSDFQPKVENKSFPKLEYNYFVQANYDTDNELLETSHKFSLNPGLYYQNLIQDMPSSDFSMCWLFRNPTDL